jgi:electron transfer flavoprotein beta subunit
VKILVIGCDAFALEAALRLIEAGADNGEDGDGEVIVASVGPQAAEEGLRAQLARGAGRAIRVWDPVLEGADALAVAAVLATLAGREHPHLILCGAQSADAADTVSGVAVAGLLDLPRVALVSAIERDGGRLTVRRELAGGASELLRLATPALLSVQSAANEPRRATLRDIKRAREKPLAVLTLDALGLDAAGVQARAGSRTLRLLEREPRAGAQMLTGPASEIAAQISELIGAELRG